MASRTALRSRDNGVVVVDEPKGSEVSRLPGWVRFPLVVLAALVLNATLYSVSAGYTGPELAAVSRNLTETWQIGAMAAWKLAELGIAWYACYDCG